MVDEQHQPGETHHGNLRRYATYWQFVTFAAMTFVAFVTPIQANRRDFVRNGATGLPWRLCTGIILVQRGSLYNGKPV